MAVPFVPLPAPTLIGPTVCVPNVKVTVPAAFTPPADQLAIVAVSVTTSLYCTVVGVAVTAVVVPAWVIVKVPVAQSQLVTKFAPPL